VTRHVKEEKVDYDPKQDDLDEIEDMEGIETSRFEIRLEKKQ